MRMVEEAIEKAWKKRSRCSRKGTRKGREKMGIPNPYLKKQPGLLNRNDLVQVTTLKIRISKGSKKQLKSCRKTR